MTQDYYWRDDSCIHSAIQSISANSIRTRAWPKFCPILARFWLTSTRDLLFDIRIDFGRFSTLFALPAPLPVQRRHFRLGGVILSDADNGGDDLNRGTVEDLHLLDCAFCLFGDCAF